MLEDNKQRYVKTSPDVWLYILYFKIQKLDLNKCCFEKGPWARMGWLSCMLQIIKDIVYIYIHNRYSSGNQFCWLLVIHGYCRYCRYLTTRSRVDFFRLCYGNLFSTCILLFTKTRLEEMKHVSKLCITVFNNHWEKLRPGKLTAGIWKFTPLKRKVIWTKPPWRWVP